MISTADVCVGASEADHDLSGLEGHRLRTHGGVSEAKVPFILNVPLNDEYKLKAGATTLSHKIVLERSGRFSILNSVAPHAATAATTPTTRSAPDRPSSPLSR